MQVNRLWFWLRDENGDLFIPKKPFDFKIFKEAEEYVGSLDRDHVDKKIFDLFNEVLFLETSPPLYYAKGNDDFQLLKDNLHQKYENYRTARLEELNKNINTVIVNLSKDNIGYKSAPISLVEKFTEWRNGELEIIKQKPSTSSSLSDGTPLADQQSNQL